MQSSQEKITHPLLRFIERHSLLFALLLFGILFVGVDRLLNEYYLPDAKGIENSYYHHGLRKNFRGTVSWGKEKHPVYTNDLGCKDDRRRTVPRDVDRHRVLFIGDSFTEGAGLPFEQTFVSMFRKGFPELDVLGCGSVSFSPKLYYYRLKYLLEVEKLHFDELIVFIDISDINDEIEYSIWTPVEESPLRRLDSWLRSVSFTYKILRNSVLSVEDSKTLQRLIRWIDAGKAVSQDSPAATTNVTAQPAAVSAAEPQKTARGVAPLARPEVVMPPDFRANRVVERPRWTYDPIIYEKWGKSGMALAQYHMDLIARLMREQHIPMTIAVYPWPDQIRQGEHHSIQQTEWRRFSEERGIGFLSYFDEFVQDDHEGVIQKYFIPGDVHWNEPGHRLVYEKLRDRYRKSHENQ